MSVKILGIIPARYGSTRLPGKMLLPIGGKTLIQRTFENAREADQLDELVIATDDIRIFSHAQEFGAQAIMTSLSCPSGTDRLSEVLQLRSEWENVDAIVNIQGDEPCLSPIAINQTIQALLNDSQADMATLAAPLRCAEEAKRSSVVKCVLDQRNFALYFSRGLIPSNKQLNFDSSISYFRHIGMYVYRPGVLRALSRLPPTPLQMAEDLEQLKALENGYRIKVAITDSSPIGVDILEDIYQLEQWICRKQNTFL